MKIKNQTFDIIALTSSFICAIHCAAVPILLSFPSLSSLHFLHNPLIEWSFIGLGVVFVFVSLWPSYKKVHRKSGPLLIAALGFGTIALGRLDFSGTWEVVHTVFGAIMVAVAHFINWKLLRFRGGHKH
ncbi:MerC domain-containing protein [Flagellimonas halotolerans]|uniref:MerC domain-containing protein n=1 Tax=Flagellimonas halotolerans TaxID=3112164 RepID=A0ABU6ISK1_9FLAO|nr:MULTISPECIES: MerC domain-containing protein [unclassified Allomuricauda]MEC3966181.1 MerC domain-containing protein [Muricauda sp. SYSU M86414]MEC4266046.1 MerC domain-containing protein [Muricauda sp. SYSU M84420]